MLSTHGFVSQISQSYFRSLIRAVSTDNEKIEFSLNIVALIPHIIDKNNTRCYTLC